MNRFKAGDRVIVRERLPNSPPSEWSFEQGVVRRDGDDAGYYVSVDGTVAMYSFYDVKKFDPMTFKMLRLDESTIRRAEDELRDRWESA